MERYAKLMEEVEAEEEKQEGNNVKLQMLNGKAVKIGIFIIVHKYLLW